MKKQMQFTILTGFLATMCFLAGCGEQAQQSAEKIEADSPQVQELIQAASIDEPTAEEKIPDEKPEETAQVEESEATVSANPVVTMTTTLGVIRIELYPAQAPKTVENFLKYTDEGFYNGTIFHRVIKGFMIQGGGFTQDRQLKSTQAPIVNECSLDLRNKRGTIAMARKNAPNSATSQFFINHADNRSLDHDGPYKPGYAVFGKVIEGMEVVDKIAALPVKGLSMTFQHLPVTTVVIESAEQE